MVCEYQELNYTITVGTTNESSIIELGAFLRYGSGTVKHDIHSEKLRRDEVYFVQVEVITYFNTAVSYNHTFGEQQFHYYDINNLTPNICIVTLFILLSSCMQ